MRPIIVIPTRFASTRLLGKALEDIHGTPMTEHVWRRGMEASLGTVIAAAADRKIASSIDKVGGYAVLTDPALRSGSDRFHAALPVIDPQTDCDTVQGDLPTIDPEAIRAVLAPLKSGSGCEIATLANGIETPTKLAAP